MPTLYRSSDASAPVLTGVAGSLFDVLDACLVNGYGAKSAAGWTKPFSDATNAVYRTDTVTGIGCYVRVTQGAANVYEIRAYESMTDAVTGLFPTLQTWAQTSATTTSVSCSWDLVADNRTFWMRPRINAGAVPNTGSSLNSTRLFGAGEYAPADPLNTNCYFVAGGDSSSNGGPRWMNNSNMLGAGTQPGASIVLPTGLHTASTMNISSPAAKSAASPFTSSAQEPFDGTHRLFPALIGGPVDGMRYVGRLRGVSLPSHDFTFAVEADFPVIPVSADVELWWSITSPLSGWATGMTGLYVHLTGW